MPVNEDGEPEATPGDDKGAEQDKGDKNPDDKIKEMQHNPPSHPDYVPPKNGDGEKVKNPNGKGSGFPDKDGNVWVPTTHGGTHAPHWDVQHPDGTHTNVYPV